jgi:hypothetical protein
MYLAAAGGIKGGAVQHDGMFAFALQRFDHVSVELEEKRIVVVKAFSHGRLPKLPALPKLVIENPGPQQITAIPAILAILAIPQYG